LRRKYVNSVPPTPTIAQWSTGTDAEILAMIQMADRGDLDLTEVWQVGDERTVHLDAISTMPSGIGETQPAQDVVLVLASADSKVLDNTNACYKYQYKTATSGRTYPSFLVTVKGHLSNYGVITTAQSTGIGSLGWNGTPRRTWCNNQFRQAVPSSLRSIFKEVLLRQATSANVMQTSDGDYFFFPTEKEMFGKRTYSPPLEADEFTQWEYFTDIEHRKSGTSRWLRSAENGSADYWTLYNSAGNIDDSRPWGASGLRPCGCI
jgi:hypothetical protein